MFCIQQMIYLLNLISFCAIQYVIVQASPSSFDDLFEPESRLQSPRNLITRWTDLHRQIYVDYPTDNLNAAQLSDILAEMSSIEQTKVFKQGLEPLIASTGFRINKYKFLVAKSYEANLLINTMDKTITNLLMKTFDHESNDCTKEYFELLEEIYKTLDEIPTSAGLNENRELQYRSCWYRLMESLKTGTMVLGSSLRTPLNKLSLLIHPNSDEPILPWTQSNVNPFLYAKKIREFLEIIIKQDKNESINYKKEFKHLVEHPCKLIIEASAYNMKHIYALLKFNGFRKDYMSSVHTMILNRYSICNQILTDIDNIKANLVPNAIFNMQGQMQSDTSTSNPSYDLVMQHPSLELDNELDAIVFNVNNKSRRKYTKFAPSTSDSSGRAKYTKGNHEKANKTDKTVLKIFGRVRRNNNLFRPTFWSDGTFSYETEEYLILNCKDKWVEDGNGTHEDPKKSFGSENENLLSDDFNEYDKPIVIKIDKAFGRGKNAKYPVIWSNGSASLETKDFLFNNYYDLYMRATRELVNIRQKRWVKKRKLEEFNEYQQDQSNDSQSS